MKADVIHKHRHKKKIADNKRCSKNHKPVKFERLTY